MALDNRCEWIRTPSHRSPLIEEESMRPGDRLVQWYKYRSVIWRCWLSDGNDVQSVKKAVQLVAKDSIPEQTEVDNW